MSVQVDYFSTSRFLIKKDKVERFKELVELLRDESNTGSGYYSSEHYVTLKQFGENAFSLHTGGYCDGGPDIWDTIINGFNQDEYKTEEEQNDYNGSHSIFTLIQDMLEENSWFFVDSTGFEKGNIYNHTWFYHANGKMDGIDTWKLKKNILDSHGINDKIY